MNDKKIDIATILCWMALVVGVIILLIFIGADIIEKNEKKKIKEGTNRPDTSISITNEDGNNEDEESKDNNDDKEEKNNQDEEKTSTGKKESSKIATEETHFNYMQGTKDGKFNPSAGITRAEAATIFARLDENFNETISYYNSEYSDVKQKSWYSNYIGYCNREFIMQGYEDGTFKPNQNMKKAEFLVAVVKYVEADYFGSTSTFKDVKGKWHEEYIGYLEHKGYLTKKADGTLGVNDYITRAEVCNVINNVLNRKPNKKMIDASNKKTSFKDVTKKNWFYYDVIEATTFHDISDFHKTN